MEVMMPRRPADFGPVDEPMSVAADAGATIGEGGVVLVNFGWHRHLRDGGPACRGRAPTPRGGRSCHLSSSSPRSRLKIAGGTGSPLRPVAFVPKR
jgi:hypothetical protein